MNQKLYDDYISIGNVIINHIKEHKDSLPAFLENIENVKTRVEKEIILHQAEVGELLANQYLERYNNDFDLALKELELEKTEQLAKANNQHHKRNFIAIYSRAKTKIQSKKIDANWQPSIWEPQLPPKYNGLFSNQKRLDIIYRIIVTVGFLLLLYFLHIWVDNLYEADAKRLVGGIVYVLIFGGGFVGLIYLWTKEKED